MQLETQAITLSPVVLVQTLGNDAPPVAVVSDQPIARSYSAVYSLFGHDTLTSQNLVGYGILAGGQGSDTYLIQPGASVVVSEHGFSNGDTLNVSESFSDFSFHRLDGHHLLMQHGQTKIVVEDWEQAAARFETFLFKDVTFGYEQFQAAVIAKLTPVESVLDADGLAAFRSSIDRAEPAEKAAAVAALDAAEFSKDPANVYRFYNVENGRHFLTGSATERDLVIKNYDQFVFEGPAFKSEAAGANSVEVFRFYNASTGAHFYTSSTDERQYVSDHYREFAYEGAVFNAHASAAEGDKPLFRFYNVDTHAHFYTVDAAERDATIANYPQYHYEGVAFYVG